MALSEVFEVTVGVHHRSVLSPLLFIIVLEDLSRNLNTQIPWELLFTDDLVIMTETLQECVEKLKNWKTGCREGG